MGNSPDRAGGALGAFESTLSARRQRDAWPTSGRIGPCEAARLALSSTHCAAEPPQVNPSTGGPFALGDPGFLSSFPQLLVGTPCGRASNMQALPPKEALTVWQRSTSVLQLPALPVVARRLNPPDRSGAVPLYHPPAPTTAPAWMNKYPCWQILRSQLKKPVLHITRAARRMLRSQPTLRDRQNPLRPRARDQGPGKPLAWPSSISCRSTTGQRDLCSCQSLARMRMRSALRERPSTSATT